MLYNNILKYIKELQIPFIAAITLILTVTLCGHVSGQNCPAVSLPVTENFSTTDSLPACWERGQNFDNVTMWSRVVTLAGYTGGNVLMMTCDSGISNVHRSIVMTRTLSQSPTGIRMRFKAKAEFGTAGKAVLHIGVCHSDNPNFIQNFGFDTVDAVEFTTSGVWQEYTIEFNNYSGSGDRPAFLMSQPQQTGHSHRIYIDDVIMERCAVSDLSVSHRTNDGLTLHWSSYGDGGANLTATPQGGGATLTFNNITNPYTVTGLQPQTTYTLTLTPQCAGESAAGYAQSITVATLAAPHLGLAYCADFESSQLPEGWYGSEGASTTLNTQYAGIRSLALNKDAVAVLPQLKTSGGAAVALNSLMIGMKVQYSHSSCRLELAATDYPEEEESYETLATLSPAEAGTWETVLQSLATYNGTARYLVLRATATAVSSASATVYIDEMHVGRCLLTGVRLKEYTSSTATLEWDIPLEDGNVTLEPVVGGGNTLTVTPSDGSTEDGKRIYTIEGLEAGSSHSWLVYGSCDDVHCDATTVSVTTFAQDYTLPYCTDFEQEGMLPTDWTTAGGYTGLTSTQQHSGSRSLALTTTGSNKAVAVLPPINAPSGGVVSFAVYSSYTGIGEVGMIEDAGDAATFSVIGQVSVGSGEWMRHSVAVTGLTPAEGRLALRYNHNYSGQRTLWIDDLTVASCGVSGVGVHGERASGATLTWDTTGGPVDVQLRREDTSWQQNYPNAVSPLTLEGLEAGTTYQYYLRSHCDTTASGEETGCWVYGGNFTTNSNALTADYCHPTTLNIGSTTWTLPYLEDESYDGLIVSLEAKGDGILLVGLMTLENDPSTFTAIGGQWSTASGQWSRHTVTLTGHETRGHYIALRATGGSVQVQHLRISRGSLTNVQATSVLATQATLTWSTEGAVDSVRVDLSADGAPSLSTTVAASDSILTLTGLTANADYHYSLTALNNLSGDGCSVDEGDFSTLSADIVAGWCENFEQTAAGSLPRGWRVESGEWRVEGGKLSVESYGNVLVVLPEAPAAISGLKLRADIYNLNDNLNINGGSLLIAGVMTNASNATTFVPTDTIRPTATERTYVLDLSGYTGNGRHVALRYVSPSTTRTLYIDNMGLAESQIGLLGADQVTDHSVRLRWEPAANVTIEYGAQSITAEGREVTIDNLTANRAYTFSVRPTSNTSDCGTVTVSTHTLPQSMVPPVCIDLEDYDNSTSLPYGWKGYTLPEGTQPESQTQHIYGSGYRAIAFYTSVGQVSTVVSPMIETSHLANYYLSFYLHNNNSGTMQVGVMIDPGDTNTFTPVQSFGYCGVWTRCEVSLAGVPSAARYIAFRYVSDGSWYSEAFIDKLMLHTCPMPTVATDNPRPTSFEVDWSGTVDSVWIQIGDRAPVINDSSPYLVSGLTPNTTYDVKVWPVCGNSAFQCHTVDLQETTVPTPTTIPTTWDFNNSTLPAGWHFWNTEGGGWSLENGALQLYAGAGASLTTLLPLVDISDLCEAQNVLYLRFTANVSSAGTLQLGTVANLRDTSTFTPVAGQQWSVAAGEQEITATINAVLLADAFPALRLIAPDGSSTALTLDNASIDRCFAVHARITDETPTSVTIEWDNIGAESMQINYGNQSVTVTESPYTITGLDPNEYYTFSFVANCLCNEVSGTAPAASFTGRQPALPTGVPVCYNFDNDAVGTFPVTWRRMGGSDGSYPRVISTNAYNGNSMDFYTDGGHSLYVALEPLADTVGDVVVGGRVWSMQGEMGSAGPLELGVMTKTTDLSTYTPVGDVTIDRVGLYHSFHIPVTAAQRGSKRYLVFKFTPSTGYHIYMDEITVAACGVSAIRYDDSLLHVTTLPAGSPYYLSVHNYESGAFRSRSTTDSVVTLASLGISLDTLYSVSARPACTDDSWPTCNQESLRMGDSIPIPYCEDFSGNGSTYGWEVFAHSDVGFPWLTNGYHMRPISGTAGDVLWLPVMPVTVGQLYVKLDVEVWNLGSERPYLDLGYIHNGAFVTLVELRNNQQRETHYVAMPPCSARRLAIRGRSPSGMQDIAINNLQLTTYPEPSTFRMPQTGYAQQHLYWDNSADNARYTFEWGPHGFTRGTGTTVVSDSCHVVFTPLNPSITYDFYLTDTAGNPFCHRHTFTSMPAPQAVPYCNSSTRYPAAGELLKLPETVTAVSDLTLLLTWSTSGNSYLEIGALTDNNDDATFQPIDTLYPDGNDIERHDAVDLSSYSDTGHFVALRFSGDGNMVKKINLQSVPQPEFRVMTSHTVEARTENENPDYYIRACRSGQSQLSGLLYHVTTTPFTLTGLNMYTDYNLYVVSSANATTCAPPVSVRTHLDEPVPYCTSVAYQPQGWQVYGDYHMVPYILVDSLPLLHLYLSGSGDVTVGAVSHIDDTSDFVALSTLTLGDDETHLHLGPYASQIGGRHYLVLRYDGGNVSSLKVETIPLPTFEVLNSTTINATLSEDATADYYVEVCNQGASQGSGTVYHITSTNYNISPLAKFTFFDLYVKSRPDSTTCFAPTTLRTHRDIEPPYCMDQTNNDYDGWRITGSHRVMPFTIIDTMADLYVTFTSRGDLALGVQPSLVDNSGFVPILSYQSEDWERHTVSLALFAALVADNHYIALVGGEIQSVYLHTCPEPVASLSAFNTVRFEQSEEDIEYWIEYNDTVVQATSNPFFITNLQQNTLYNFSYRCSNATAGCMPPTTILTGVQIHAPHCAHLGSYRFGMGSLPPGWFTLQGESGSQYAIMPIIDLDSASRLFTRLRYKIEANGTLFSVGVMTDPADPATFVPLNTVTHITDGYDTLVVNFAEYADTGLYVAFLASGSQPHNVYLDNIELQTVPFAHYLLTSHNSVLVKPIGIPSFPHPSTITYGAHSLTVDSLPWLVEGLDDNTTYAFNLSSEGSSPCIPSVDVTTTWLASTPLCGLQTTLHPLAPFWRGPQLADTNISSLLFRASIQTDADNSRLAIGIMSIHNVDSTFLPLDTLTLSAGTALYTSSLQTAHYPLPTTHSSFLALRLLDGNATLSDITLDYCLTPVSAHLALMRHNIVRVELDSAESVQGLWLAYGVAGSPDTSWIQLDSLPLDFLCDNSTTYHFHFACDSAAASCSTPLSITTLDPPPTLSWCHNFDSDMSGQLPANWQVATAQSDLQRVAVVTSQSHSHSRSLQFSANIDHKAIAVLPDLGVDSLGGLYLSFWMQATGNSSRVEVGVIADPTAPSSFLPLQTFQGNPSGLWERKTLILSNVPQGYYYIALRALGAASNNQFCIDDIHISECGALGLEVSQVEANQITLRWRQTGTPHISVTVLPENDAPWTIEPQAPLLSVNQSLSHLVTQSLTIDGLQPLSNYQFAFSASCDTSLNYELTTDPCQQANLYRDTVHVFCPNGSDGCIDPTNLSAAYTTCYYGTYQNPTLNSGVIDFGYASPLSRHTVHYDPTETDPRTSNLLHTVPSGTAASVRLGNWSSNNSAPQAECITYALSVDTLEHDLLILRYAAVLQDPDHDTYNQPRFRLDILDEAGNPLDTACGRKDFIANHNMGWNIAPNNVLWKDWTTVGLDLMPYAGQTILIRLTTYDCNEGSHYGYAYFTLECMRKNITSSGCGIIAENHFSAPEGFNYRWYTSADTTTLSDSITVIVPSNNDISYLCDISAIDNPSCFFTMSAFAGTRFPLSLFDYNVQLAPCSFDVSFRNRSTISMDQINPVGTGEGVETSRWYLGIGDTIVSHNITTTYYEEGTYNVSLITGIAGDACLDTLTIPLTLAFPPTGIRIEGITERCWNAPADTLHLYNVADQPILSSDPWIVLDSQLVGTHLLRHYGLILDSSSLITHDSTRNATFTVDALDSVGCTHTFSHTVTVYPSYRLHQTERICSLLLPYAWSDTTVNDVNITPLDTNHYTVYRTTVNGCDSILSLTLLQHDNFYYTPRDTAYDDLCDNRTYFFSDSLLTPDHSVTQSLSHSDTQILIYTDTLTSFIGCDSLSTIVLTIYPTFDHHTYDTICSGQWSLASGQWSENSYPFTDSSYDATGIYPHHLFSIHGCDSMSTLHLKVWPAYNLHFFDTICDAHWTASSGPWVAHTYPFEDTSYNVTGDYLHLFVTNSQLPTANCDSIRTLHLKVYPTYDLHFHDTIYDGDRYTFEETIYDTTGIYPHLLTTSYQLPAAGCDSLRTLHLQRNRRHFIDTVVCLNGLPFYWHGKLFSANNQLPTTNYQLYTDTLHLSTNSQQPTANWDSLLVMRVIVRDTSSTTDIVHSCDSLRWVHSPDTLYRTTTSQVFRRLTQQTPFDTTGLASAYALFENTPLTFDVFNSPFTTHHSSFNIQCDSVRHLDLTIDYTHYYTDYQIACDSLLWPDLSATQSLSHTATQTLYYRDTLGIVGPLGSFHTTGPVDTLITRGGCDSVVNLDLNIRHATYHCDIDTFCFGEQYQWRSQSAGSLDTMLANHNHYYLTETLQTHTFHHPHHSSLTITCDSVRAIELTQLARPRLLVIDSIDCWRERHHVKITTDVPYYRWTLQDSGQFDALGPRGSVDVPFPPHALKLLTVTDYHPDYALCPVDTTLSLPHIEVPVAEIKVNPEKLSRDFPTFHAFDITRSEVVSRLWMLDGVHQQEQGKTFSATIEEGLDSVEIALEVFNGICYDTAITILPFVRSDLFAPNVFTPEGDDDNRLFTILGYNIFYAELEIYNRRGLLVYSSKASFPDGNLTFSWDGLDLYGKPAHQGAYVWRLSYRAFSDILQTQVGTVTLIR